MAELQIFCSTQFEDNVLNLLQEGVAPHHVVFPKKPAENILAQPTADPAFAQSDIAFGQPDVESILASSCLRWVQLTTAGYTRYDTPEFRAAVTERELLMTNSSSVYSEPCAEHVFAFMLAQARRLPQMLLARDDFGSSQWTKLRQASRCLQNQRVVILGFGAIATRLVAMLAPFKMNIVALRREPKGDEGVLVVSPDDIRPSLAEADHVIDILPDNAASRHFISAERLGWMKPGAIFYNIGRGTTVDQIALADCLKSGHLEAAWLDVTDPEPLPQGHPLLSLPNCFITPHTAGGHGNESESLVRHFLDNFRRYLTQTPLHDQIM